MASWYLSTFCQLVPSVPGRRHLRSAGRGELDFPMSICHVRGTGRRLSMPVLRPGTFCLTVSRTLILLCKPLSAILRPSFLYTNTLSAIEVSFKRRHINPLLFIITKTGKIASSRFTFFLLKQKIRCLTEFASVAIVEHWLPSVHKIHHHVVSCPHWAVSSYLDVETLAPVLVYTTTKYKITHRCI